MEFTGTSTLRDVLLDKQGNQPLLVPTERQDIGRVSQGPEYLGCSPQEHATTKQPLIELIMLGELDKVVLS
jgi:hypothetical protein